MRFRSPAFFTCGFVTALAFGGSAAYAANGGTFLLGRANKATATTALTNTEGTALGLASKAGTPPLRVNQSTKVAKLNADLLDGFNSSELALAAGRTGVIVGSHTDGDGFVNTARCPSGSIATGGGGYSSGTRDYLYYSGPDFNAGGALVPNSWFAVADGDTVAWVVCYNPRGAVPGATTKAPSMAARGALAASASVKSTQPGQSTQKPMP